MTAFSLGDHSCVRRRLGLISLTPERLPNKPTCLLINCAIWWGEYLPQIVFVSTSIEAHGGQRDKTREAPFNKIYYRLSGLVLATNQFHSEYNP